MLICQKEIEFLGMVFADGAYTPGTHIAEELQKFSDSPLTRKQIQQFLALSNISEILSLELHKWQNHSSLYSRKMRTLGQKSRLKLLEN